MPPEPKSFAVTQRHLGRQEGDDGGDAPYLADTPERGAGLVPGLEFRAEGRRGLGALGVDEARIDGIHADTTRAQRAASTPVIASSAPWCRCRRRFPPAGRW